jgi:hypothetical protein
MKLNSITQLALSALTNEWQRLGALKVATGLHANAFDDLRWAGLAQEKRTPITRNGVACGEVIELKLS